MSQSPAQVEYCDKIYALFEKHFPGKYDRSYVENLLKANVGREEEVYDQFVDQFEDLPGPASPNSNDETYETEARSSIVIHDDSSVISAALNDTKNNNDNNSGSSKRSSGKKRRKGGLSAIIASDAVESANSGNNNNGTKSNNLKPQSKHVAKKKSKHKMDLESFEKLLSNIEKGVLTKPSKPSMKPKQTSNKQKTGKNAKSTKNSKNANKSDTNNTKTNNKKSTSNDSGTLNNSSKNKKKSKDTNNNTPSTEDSSKNNNNNINNSTNDTSTSTSSSSGKKEGKKRDSNKKKDKKKKLSKTKMSNDDKFVTVADESNKNNNNNNEEDAGFDTTVTESMQDTFAQAIRAMKQQALAEGLDTGNDKEGGTGGGAGSGGGFEYSAVNVVLRVRPVNSMELDHETRLLFKMEFDMDDKDWQIFSQERLKLLAQDSKKEIDLSEWDIDKVCDWFESIKLDGYKSRCRRKKVNGEYLQNIPRYMEKKPLEFDNRDNFVVAFKSHDQSHKYDFDKVFVPQKDNNFVFDNLGPGLVNNLINGYNVTIFAYGQTGTGKTFTMFGDDYDVTTKNNNDSESGMESGYNTENDVTLDENGDNYTISSPQPRDENGNEEKETNGVDPNSMGIIPKTLMLLFKEFERSKDIAFFNVQIAIMEIYCEKLRDLVRPRMKLTLRYVGQNSKVDNLTYLDVNSADEALKVIDKSKKHRVTAETKQNLTSSRSHCIIVVKIDSTLHNGTQQASTLTFGDLAGSEKISKTGAKNQRLREAKKIVQSLFALKKTIRALASNQPFVPYQDSVLTKLLRDSIGGNSKTTIIVTASPHEYNRSETLSTLRFAEMAKKIQNDASVNRLLSRDEMEAQIHALQEQLQYLRKQKAKKSRFTSTDFRVLQRQLVEAGTKAEEFQSKYLNAEIQLLVKTQYIQEIENIIEKKNKQLRSLRDCFVEIRNAIFDYKDSKENGGNNGKGKNDKNSKNDDIGEKILKMLQKIDTSDMDQKLNQNIPLSDMKSEDEKGTDFEYDESSSDDG